MNENSTTGICNDELKKVFNSECKPSAKSLDFLRMFARSYSYSEEESLQSEFLTVCLN